MDLSHIVIAIIAVFLAFTVQSIVGYAGTLIGFPILLTVFDLQEASALFGILYVVFSSIFVYKEWKHIDKRVVAELGIGIIFGIIIGIYLLKYGNPVVLKKLLGVLIIAYIGYVYMKKRKIMIFRRLGLLFGFLGGILGGVYSIGGPLLITYIHNKIDKARVLRATVIGSLAIINYVRIPLMVYWDIITTDTIYLSLLVMPFFLLSLYLGHVLHKRLDENLFKQIFAVLLFVSGVFLIVS